MTHITPAQLDRIQALLVDRPQLRLALDVSGIATCDGMAIEHENGSVYHPLAFLDLIDGPEPELIDILKGPNDQNH